MSLAEKSRSVTDFGCDRWPLHYACRIGHLEQVQHLVDVLKSSVNEQDAHDATPLYLAALTGRNEICKFLLERGARCDPNSGGDAARVFYVALTPELRRLLREWSLSAASRDPFLDSLRRSFNDPTHADCAYERGITKLPIYLHSILLVARCPSIEDFIQQNERFEAEGGCRFELRLDQIHTQYGAPFDENAVTHFLEFLYTGQIDIREEGLAMQIQQLAFKLNLSWLEEQLKIALEEFNRKKKSKITAANFRCDISDEKGLRSEMKKLARLVSTPHAELDSVQSLEKRLAMSDVTVQCLDYTWSLNCFRLDQSEYFDRALSGSFREAHESFIDLSHLMPSPDAWQLAIQWMYADAFLDLEDVSLENAINVVELGFAILCPRLSSYVANFVLAPSVDMNNVFELLGLARSHGFERLEEFCVDVIGQNLKKFASSDELREVLAQEASGIAQSGDVNVIDLPLAAEIRRAILKRGSPDDRLLHLDLLQSLVQETCRQ